MTRSPVRRALAVAALAAAVAPRALPADDRDRLDAEIKVTVGVAYMNNDQFDEALTRFEEAAALDPENGTAHFLAATTLSRLKRYEDALTEIEAARRFTAQAPPGRLDWFAGEAQYWLGRYQEAESSFRKALEADSQDAYAHFYLAMTLLQLGRGKEAGPQFDRAAELDAELGASGTFFAGKAYYDSGDVELARQEFEKALRGTTTSDNARRASTNYISALDEIESTGPPRWEIALGLGGESDDNVLVSPDDPSLGSTAESDNRAILTLRTSYYPFYDLRGWSFGMILQAYQSLHQDQTGFDLTAPQGILSFTWGKDPLGYVYGPVGFTWVPTGKTGAVFTAQYAYTYNWLDGDSYLRTNEMAASVKIYEGNWTSTQIDLDYRDNTFFESAARTGTFAQARAIQYFYLGRRERPLRLGLRAGQNDADGLSDDDFDQGGTSGDYDYDETEAWIDVLIPLPGRVSLFTQASFQTQDYDNVNSNPALLEPDPAELREDDRLTLSFSVAWSMTERWSLVGRYLYYDNDSNKDVFTYTRGVASLGVNWYY